MMLTKSEPFTPGEIRKLQEEFDTYIKTVIDVEKKMCSAGSTRHFDSESALLGQGSAQQNLWGGGIDTLTKVVDYNSFINLRPKDNNPSNEILQPNVRKLFEELTHYFFKHLYDSGQT
jgi:hypothetical protein